MEDLKEIIYLSNEQYETLSTTGTITIDGVTLTFDPDSYIYFTPNIEGAYVRYDTASQGLDNTQKSNARTNIGAGVGSVTSVQVQAGTGLSSSVNTAQSSSLNTTISIASGYKLPTTSEWNAKGTYSKPSTGIPASDLEESYYLASNPNGYTSNIGTVTSVNNTSPDSSGNVTINIPTLDYPVTDVKIGTTSIVTNKVATLQTNSTYDASTNKILVKSDISGKLDKLTYEWNKEVAMGSSGYVKIGSFPMYDTNITIDIDATTSTSYHGTAIVVTQNTSTSSMGSAHKVDVYGDPTGIIASSLRVV